MEPNTFAITSPAIVRDTAEAELEQLAWEVKAAVEAGNRATQQGMERYREAGAALLRAKERCGHGKWLPWLAKHKIPQQRASEVMRIAKCWGKLPLSGSLRDTLQFLADEEAVDTEPQATEPPVPAHPAALPSTGEKLCRPCRTNGPKPGCQNCAAFRSQARPPAGPVPPPPTQAPQQVSSPAPSVQPEALADEPPCEREPGDDYEEIQRELAEIEAEKRQTAAATAQQTELSALQPKRNKPEREAGDDGHEVREAFKKIEATWGESLRKAVDLAKTLGDKNMKDELVKAAEPYTQRIHRWKKELPQ